jgi:hypothetical protein
MSTGNVKLDAAKIRSGVVVGGADREVIVFPAQDTREDPTRCGVKRTNSGMEVARVLCTPEPGPWLSDLVFRSLSRAGFKLVTTQTAKSSDPLRLHLNLKHLFIDDIPAEIGQGRLGVTDIEVLVTADTQTGLSAHRSFFIKAKRGGALNMDIFLQLDVDRAAQQLADEIVAAVVELSKRYPSVTTTQVSRANERQAIVARSGVLP